MDKKDFYFFNVNEVCTDNYHLRVNSCYRLALNVEASIQIIDAVLVKVYYNAHLVTLKFERLNVNEITEIKFNVFSNVKRDWKILNFTELNNADDK